MNCPVCNKEMEARTPPSPAKPFYYCQSCQLTAELKQEGEKIAKIETRK